MKSILLLEDDLSLVNGLSFAFKKQGFETDIARTLREAEAFWAVGKYDLLVLDVSLPDGTGFGFCEKVRQSSKVPIIFLTASDEETSIIMGLDMGADDCIINVMLTDDAGIHAINLAQRGVDAPTDVLSFPMNELTEGEFDPSVCERDYDADKLLLGDMVLSLERCARQAEEYGHSYARELSYLTVHSVLHLLGYDHLDEGERKRRMRAREDCIMEALGL
mgnify:CR=1 FL=1